MITLKLASVLPSGEYVLIPEPTEDPLAEARGAAAVFGQRLWWRAGYADFLQGLYRPLGVPIDSVEYWHSGWSSAYSDVFTNWANCGGTHEERELLWGFAKAWRMARYYS